MPDTDILQNSAAAPAGSQTPESSSLVIPVLEEFIRIDKKTVESGSIRVAKQVTEEVEAINVSLTSDEYLIEHVPINRYQDDNIPQARQEGDTWILPVVKEVMVKRLLLIEEVRITKRTLQRVEQQNITLRKESVTVNREESSL